METRHQAICNSEVPKGRGPSLPCPCHRRLDPCKQNYVWIPVLPHGVRRSTCCQRLADGLYTHSIQTLGLAVLIPTCFQTSKQFLETFRNNLIDIGVDPSPYGTHSFCRGGCQYLSSDRHWSLHWICKWGGWSTEFSSMTIVKYLISWNDDPTEAHDDFFNPDRTPTVKCSYCGRSCACA